MGFTYFKRPWFSATILRTIFNLCWSQGSDHFVTSFSMADVIEVTSSDPEESWYRCLQLLFQYRIPDWYDFTCRESIWNWSRCWCSIYHGLVQQPRKIFEILKSLSDWLSNQKQAFKNFSNIQTGFLWCESVWLGMGKRSGRYLSTATS